MDGIVQSSLGNFHELPASLNMYKMWFVWLMSLLALMYTASALKKNNDSQNYAREWRLFNKWQMEIIESFRSEFTANL